MTMTPRQLKQMYKQGINISTLLRREKGLVENTEEIIEIAYELQAGSYIAQMHDAHEAASKQRYAKAIANSIMHLCTPQSILEAGVGEATTLSGVLQSLNSDVKSFGFDLSWSRVAYARQYLQSKKISGVNLCTGTLFHIPFADKSMDVVYTSHSIEPNGGNELPILKELFRVARKYLILVEPCYEMANDEQKARMNLHGYCKNLKSISESLGYEIVEHKPFLFNVNPLNPAAITVIKKIEDTPASSYFFACPKFRTQLDKIDNILFSPEALVAYPIVGGIPCLRIENGIFASEYIEFMGTNSGIV